MELRQKLLDFIHLSRANSGIIVINGDSKEASVIPRVDFNDLNSDFALI